MSYDLPPQSNIQNVMTAQQIAQDLAREKQEAEQRARREREQREAALIAEQRLRMEQTQQRR